MRIDGFPAVQPEALDHHCESGSAGHAGGKGPKSGASTGSAYDVPDTSRLPQRSADKSAAPDDFGKILNLLGQAKEVDTPEEKADVLGDAIGAIVELLNDPTKGADGSSRPAASSIDTISGRNGQMIEDLYHGHGDHQGSATGGEKHAGHDDHAPGNHGTDAAGKHEGHHPAPSVDAASGGHSGHGGMATTTTASDVAPSWLTDALGDRMEADGTLSPMMVGTGHQDHGMGELLNVHEIFESAGALGIDGEAFIQDFMSDTSNFNDSRHLKGDMLAGALTVLNDVMAVVTMGGLKGDPATLELVQGAATNAAFAGDADSLRQILEDAGGDTSMMSDDQLLNVWGGNSHMYNHAVLVGAENNGAAVLTHLRSLNDNAMDGTEAGTRGGYNDKGEYRERTNSEFEFFDKSRDFLASVAEFLPAMTGGTQTADMPPPSYAAVDHSQHAHG